MELSPMRPLHRGAATAAALLLSTYPSNRLTAQRPLQATDYYKLVVVANPALSPDGRRVAFAVTTVVEDKDKRHSEIWMASADGSGKPYRYTSPATEASSPRWSPDGSLLAFTSKREGADDDAWFLRTGAPGGEAFQIAGVHALPVFSPDGRQLLYEWRGPEPDSLKQQPWRERVSPAAITRGPDPKRFDGRLYTSLPVVADERGLVPPRETRRRGTSTSRPSMAATRPSSRLVRWLRPIPPGRPTAGRSCSSRTRRRRWNWMCSRGPSSTCSPSPTGACGGSRRDTRKTRHRHGRRTGSGSRSSARRAAGKRTTSASCPRAAGRSAT